MVIKSKLNDLWYFYIKDNIYSNNIWKKMPFAKNIFLWIYKHQFLFEDLCETLSIRLMKQNKTEYMLCTTDCLFNTNADLFSQKI